MENQHLNIQITKDGQPCTKPFVMNGNVMFPDANGCVRFINQDYLKTLMEVQKFREEQIDDMMKKCMSSDEETAQLFGLDLDTWLKYCAPNAESPIHINTNEFNCSVAHIKALKPGSLEQCRCLHKLRDYATYFYDKDKKAPSLLGDESD